MTQSPNDAAAKRVSVEMHKRETTSQAWNLKLEDAGEGWAIASMVIREDMLNGHGFTHGGMIFSLADTAFAWACNSRNVNTVAQQASISFLSPAKPGERLIAEAREDAVEGRTGVYSVSVKADDGRVVAIFKGLSRSIGGKVIEKTEALND